MNSLAVLAVKGRVRFRPPKRLTPPQAGARGQSHQGTKPRRNGSGQGRDSLQRQGFYPGAHQLGQPGPSQGDDAINRSRTAALNTPARMRCTTPTVAGASSTDSFLITTWTSLGRTAASWRGDRSLSVKAHGGLLLDARERGLGG